MYGYTFLYVRIKSYFIPNIRINILVGEIKDEI